MTARPMSPAREAALATLEELVRDVARCFWGRVDELAFDLICAVIKDRAACIAADVLCRGDTDTITLGSRSYTIRTVDDLRTYLEREVPEPPR